MREVQYFAEFIDDDTGEVFTSYGFLSYTAARVFVNNAIKQGHVLSAKPVNTTVNGCPASVYIGMEGVTPYNTRVRMTLTED